MQIEVVDSRIDKDCGCPEEDLVIGGCFITAHMEKDSGGHLLLDMGDWEDERLVDCKNMEELKEKAVEWVEEMYKRWALEQQENGDER